MATPPTDANPVKSVTDPPPPDTNPVDSVIDTPPPPANPDDSALIKIKKRKTNAVAMEKFRAKKKKKFEDLETSGDPELVAKASNIIVAEENYYKSVAQKN